MPSKSQIPPISDDSLFVMISKFGMSEEYLLSPQNIFLMVYYVYLNECDTVISVNANEEPPENLQTYLNDHAYLSCILMNNLNKHYKPLHEKLTNLSLDTELTNLEKQWLLFLTSLKVFFQDNSYFRGNFSTYTDTLARLFLESEADSFIKFYQASTREHQQLWKAIQHNNTFIFGTYPADHDLDPVKIKNKYNAYNHVVKKDGGSGYSSYSYIESTLGNLMVFLKASTPTIMIEMLTEQPSIYSYLNPIQFACTLNDNQIDIIATCLHKIKPSATPLIKDYIGIFSELLHTNPTVTIKFHNIACIFHAKGYLEKVYLLNDEERIIASINMNTFFDLNTLKTVLNLNTQMQTLIEYIDINAWEQVDTQLNSLAGHLYYATKRRLLPCEEPESIITFQRKKKKLPYKTSSLLARRSRINNAFNTEWHDYKSKSKTVVTVDSLTYHYLNQFYIALKKKRMRLSDDEKLILHIDENNRLIDTYKIMTDPIKSTLLVFKSYINCEKLMQTLPWINKTETPRGLNSKPNTDLFNGTYAHRRIKIIKSKKLRRRKPENPDEPTISPVHQLNRL